MRSSCAPALPAVPGAALSISLAKLMVRRTGVQATDVLPLLVWSSQVAATLLGCLLLLKRPSLLPMLWAQLATPAP